MLGPARAQPQGNEPNYLISKCLNDLHGRRGTASEDSSSENRISVCTGDGGHTQLPPPHGRRGAGTPLRRSTSGSAPRRRQRGDGAVAAPTRVPGEQAAFVSSGRFSSRIAWRVEVCATCTLGPEGAGRVTVGPGRSPGPRLASRVRSLWPPRPWQVCVTLTPGRQLGGTAGPSVCAPSPPLACLCLSPGLDTWSVVLGVCGSREVPTARPLLGRAPGVLGVTCARALGAPAFQPLTSPTTVLPPPPPCATPP